MKKLLFLLTFMASLGCRAAGDYIVKDFGAAGDGKTPDHEAINRAIDSCEARGGGRVVLTPGTYLCGSIRLKNNVELTSRRERK